MGWFGSLNIAVKYGMVVGTLLLLTLIAGVFKIIYDRRKMTRLLLEKAGPVHAHGDEEDLNMREKDEGDLFGVRAIEAGYYGGVAQSQPSSLLGSAASTPRPQSPASLFSKPDYAQKASSVSTYEVPPSSGGASRSLDPPAAYEPRTSNKPRKQPPQPINVNGRERLQPSNAEKNGRKNHGQLGVEMSLSAPYPSTLRDPPLSPLPNPRPTALKSKAAVSVSSSTSSDSRRGSDATTVPVYFSDRPTPLSPPENPFESPSSSGSLLSSPTKSTSSNGSSHCTCGHNPALPLPPAQIAAPSARRQSILAQSARLGQVKAAAESTKSTSNTAYSSTVDQATAARQRARQSSSALPPMEDNPYARQALAVQPPSPIDDDEDEDEKSVEDLLEEHHDPVSPRTSFSFAPTASDYQRKPSVRIIEPPRQPRKLGAGVPLSSLAQPKLIRKVYANQVAGVYAPTKLA